jgi:hypothetical protein
MLTKKICESRRLTISELSRGFATNDTDCSLRDYRSYVSLSQILLKKGSENAHECAQRADSDFDFDFDFFFLERCHRDDDEFRSHIVRVSGDETWVSFVNVATKEQSEQWMHTFTKQAE